MYDKSRPENLAFLQQLRQLMDEFSDRTTVGEIGDDNALQLMAEYTSGSDKLHMAYTFDLLAHDQGADYIHSVVKNIESMIGDGWPCLAMSNHDVIRVATRWASHDNSQQFVKLLLGVLFTLRGSVCLYQGEELGLPEADVPFDKLQDPYGISFWPEFKGRDGCRTPMPWTPDQQHAGFSEATPWLPVPSEHLDFTVSQQQTQASSVLNHCKALLAWRKQHPAVINGEIELLDTASDTLLAFQRYQGDERFTFVFNFAETSQTLSATTLSTWLGETITQPLLVKGWEGLWQTHAADSEWQPLDQNS